MRASLAAALLALAACHHERGPAKPAPIDPRALAAELAETAAIVHAHRDDCPTLAAALRDVFARMRASIAVAHRAQLDTTLAKQLVIEMRAYDRSSAEYSAAIEADFTASTACAHDRGVREVLMAMPTL